MVAHGCKIHIYHFVCFELVYSIHVVYHGQFRICIHRFIKCHRGGRCSSFKMAIQVTELLFLIVLLLPVLLLNPLEPTVTSFQKNREEEEYDRAR